ncbi:MAG: DUF3576 domain-containing protein [Pseudomonadota bacterium]
MTRHPLTARAVLTVFACLFALSACGVKQDENQSYPKTEKDQRRERLGKLTGEDGLQIGGDSAKDKDAGKNPLGVNSFLWRATLDTLAFLPIAQADPFGGVILTDWYEDPDAPGERYKLNVLILDRQLRADSLKITTFRQKKDKAGAWRDTATDASLGRKLEDTVLTRARQMRVTQLGY